jgi:diaminopimelate decarboxylase
LHQHIGSNLKAKDEEVFLNTVKYIFELSQKFTDLKYINIGGGVGIQYKPIEEVIDIERLYGRVRELN